MPAGKESEFIPQNREFSQRRIQSECGLFGAYYLGHDIRSILYRAGTDLQHRAEGAAGMYVSNGREQDIVKNLGTVAVVFQEGRVVPKISDAHIGIVHTRYPTAGRSNHIPNTQPMSHDGITLGHHGNLTNASEVKEKIGEIPFGGEHPDNDSWIALNAVVRAPGNTLAEKLINAQKTFEGSWAFIISDGKQLVASRDPHGTRPLFLGYIGPQEKPEGYFPSVETAPFINLGIDEYREILPGETIVIDENGVRTVDVSPKSQRSCIFEFVYMMSPKSELLGQNVYMVRRRAGEILWHEQPVIPQGDNRVIVMPVPDSGRPSALGYFQQAQEDFGTRFTYDEGLIANRYFGRNFIKASGERAADLKFYTIKELIKDKIIVIVDDSLVRGETAYDNVKKMLEDGACEVHVRLASPVIKHPCYWGVAFSTYGELMANNIPDIEERARTLGVNSLGHLSIRGLFESVGMTDEEIKAAFERGERKFCTHCFDGFGPEMKSNETIRLVEAQKTPA